MNTVKDATQEYIDFADNLSHRISLGQLPLMAFLKHMLPSYYEYVDKVLSVFNKTAPQPVGCHNRCSSCCKLMVFISPIEALNIRHYIQKKFSFSELQRLRKETTVRHIEQQRLTKQFSDDIPQKSREYFKLNMPCEFLDSENSCSIYDARPTICRNLYVVTPPAFCGDLENIDKVQIWRHPALWKLDVAFQRCFSKSYLAMEEMDIMETLLLRMDDLFPLGTTPRQVDAGRMLALPRQNTGTSESRRSNWERLGESWI